MERTYVLGVDGGGTKTACVVLDRQGRLRGEGQAASSNWNSVGLENARRNTGEAIRAALADAGIQAEELAWACLGMGGVERPPDRERIQEWIREMLPGVPASIYNDAVVALTSGTGGDIYGVVVISGTGMIVFGFDREGNHARSGGWGALLGDGGSGFAMGSAVLKAVTWAADGRAPATRLQDAVLDFLGLAEPMDLIDWAYQEEFTWPRFAQLAPLAAQLAVEGDQAAQAIIEQAAEDLAVAVRAVLVNLGMLDQAFPLVLAGGNLRPGPLFHALSQRLKNLAPKARIIRPQVSPAMGAALLALKELEKAQAVDS